MRVPDHPILGSAPAAEKVVIEVDGRKIEAIRGEPIAAALMANGILVNRYTAKRREPRGVFCGIGRCTDCMMIVNGIPNTRTCITAVEEGMVIQTQRGKGDVR
jgi:predicted molibdopterin-dependent oxidoreductase YjgC